MIVLAITRRKRFASALMPYWIITDMSKESFKNTFGIINDVPPPSYTEQPPPNIIGWEPDRFGTRINNGQTVNILINTDRGSLFAVTKDGFLSNELEVSEENREVKILMDTKGGWITAPHPVLKKL